MADGFRSSQESQSVSEAEELLRKTAHMADDPFVALSQSFKRKTRDNKLALLYLEDEEEK